jgi:hypothetical protein
MNVVVLILHLEEVMRLITDNNDCGGFYEQALDVILQTVP